MLAEEAEKQAAFIKELVLVSVQLVLVRRVVLACRY